MNLILLSGGSGKRLWPLSNEIRSKQFLKILRNGDGYQSMIQRVYGQITAAMPDAHITIATGRSQVSSIVNQLGDKVSVCVEPARRDTFAAIALAVAYVHDKQGIATDEPVVVCPVDPYADDAYFHALEVLGRVAAVGQENLYLLGVKPTYPSEKYGYILPGALQADGCRAVDAFREKPTVEQAQKYLDEGALWNCGVFAFRLQYLLDITFRHTGIADYETLLQHYEELEKISFDYAVVEKESHIACMECSGMWKDIGTWNTLAEEMDTPTIGDVILNDTCKNTTAINELGIPLLCMGLQDMIVAISGDGILVSDKAQSSYIKPYVDELEGQVHFAEKSWGSFTVLDVQPGSMTIKILLCSGRQLSYHSHAHRDEMWTVISGRGHATIDGRTRQITPGDVVHMPAGCKHTVRAETELQLIEVQVGKEIDVTDKQKFNFI